MMNFCTLFDSVYLSRGLIMYESLKENSDAFHLYIFAFDNLAYEILNSLRLDFVTIISLEKFENQELLDIKDTRTRAEYCWTCTSSTIAYVLDNFDVPACTYLDADLYFYKSPEILLNELKGEKTVLITEHRFSRFAKLFEQKRAGRFCVQFITFTNSKESRIILDKWISQCIEWCYARYEDGKFGDQKYLETWPQDYPNVHILENHGGGIAPWNAAQYRFSKEGNSITGKRFGTKNKFEVVFFHYHFVRVISEYYADLGWNMLDNSVIELFYKPYIHELIQKERFLKVSYPEYTMIYSNRMPEGLKETVKYLYKKITKFNVINLPV